MKHIKKINEVRAAKYDKWKDEFIFEPADINDNITVYLHSEKQGFAMEISHKDQEALEKILKNNKISYTISAGNVLPF